MAGNVKPIPDEYHSVTPYLILSDAAGALDFSPVSLMIYVQDVDSVARQAVAAGAKETRPVENKFYGDRSGSFADPFGYEWHISTHVEDVPPDEMQKRAAAAAAAGG